MIESRTNQAVHLPRPFGETIMKILIAASALTLFANSALSLNIYGGFSNPDISVANRLYLTPRLGVDSAAIVSRDVGEDSGA